MFSRGSSLLSPEVLSSPEALSIVCADARYIDDVTRFTGIFEYVYTSTTLTFVPHAPENITALTQKFGVRWGAYRLFISTKGFRSSGQCTRHTLYTRRSFSVPLQI